MTVKIKKLCPAAIAPTYATASSAGADLYACLETDVTIVPGETAMIPTGLSLELPPSHAGLVFARSGLATKKGLAPANKVGVIDSDYRGEVLVALFNHGRGPVTITPGERVAQLVVTPVLTCDFIETDTLDATARGTGGFGSTGQT
ncbi:dUTP diphosphatase [Oscillospiraceae bacterium CM]|nr:dUTP diphosphatase [Oscillospiraceae bacterium CM]